MAILVLIVPETTVTAGLLSAGAFPHSFQSRVQRPGEKLTLQQTSRESRSSRNRIIYDKNVRIAVSVNTTVDLRSLDTKRNTRSFQDGEQDGWYAPGTSVTVI